LSDREARFEPLSGTERRAGPLARSHKGLRIDTNVLFDAFKLPDSSAIEPARRDWNDVLDAYRELPGWRIRRLAVLGEPGSGKSFSLQRIACDCARRALRDPGGADTAARRLGLWTRERDSLMAFIERQLGDLGRDLVALCDERGAILLLDGMNEIPPGQRRLKAQQLRKMAENERFAAIVVSCRERDFTADYGRPFDTLTLKPLSRLQIHRFLHRAYEYDEPNQGSERAEQRFWKIAGGEALRGVWTVWEAAGASFGQFWSAEEVPRENPNVYSKTSAEQDRIWHAARAEPRSLLRLAANPYLLTVMMALPTVPPNRAQLFDGFLTVLFERERKAREARHDGRSVPEPKAWQATLADLAGAMQRL